MEKLIAFNQSYWGNFAQKNWVVDGEQIPTFLSKQQ